MKSTFGRSVQCSRNLKNACLSEACSKKYERYGIY